MHFIGNQSLCQTQPKSRQIQLWTCGLLYARKGGNLCGFSDLLGPSSQEYAGQHPMVRLLTGPQLSQLGQTIFFSEACGLPLYWGIRLSMLSVLYPNLRGTTGRETVSCMIKISSSIILFTCKYKCLKCSVHCYFPSNPRLHFLGSVS